MQQTETVDKAVWQSTVSLSKKRWHPMPHKNLITWMERQQDGTMRPSSDGAYGFDDNGRYVAHIVESCDHCFAAVVAWTPNGLRTYWFGPDKAHKYDLLCEKAEELHVLGETNLDPGSGG